MKTFEMLFGNSKQEPVGELAVHWITDQIKAVPEPEQLAWAKERVDNKKLSASDGKSLTKLYLVKEEQEFEYSEFLYAVTILLGMFLNANGVKPTREEKGFMNKMGY